MIKKISIALFLLVSIGIAGLFFLYPFKKASGVEKNLSRSAALQFSKKLSDLASVSKNHFPRTVEFTQTEIDSYVHYELSQFFPQGVHEVQFNLLENSFSAKARVNFDEMQSGGNSIKNPLVGALLRGEHTLEVIAKVKARNKLGSYDILGLRIDQTEIPKPLVDLLITKLVLAKYPVVGPNIDFDLPYQLDRIDILAGKVVVHQGAS